MLTATSNNIEGLLRGIAILPKVAGKKKKEIKVKESNLTFFGGHIFFFVSMQESTHSVFWSSTDIITMIIIILKHYLIKISNILIIIYVCLALYILMHVTHLLLTTADRILSFCR